MEARAIARFVRVSPTKVDRVLRHIRGLPVERAQELLAYSPRPIAKQIGKVLTSAVANATNREPGTSPDQLFVKHAVADAGPTLKRIQPRAQGRAFRILKRMTHITIVVAERAPKAVPGAGPAERAAARGETKPETKPAGRAAKALAAVRRAAAAKPKKPAAKTAPKTAPKGGTGAAKERKERKK
jgi:large subunit ribosomal protein L22